MRTLFVALVSLVPVFVACSSDEGDNNSSSSGNSGAAAGEVSACKEGCDKMKFFNCNSASEQARCYDDCGKATKSQIELFTACAKNSVCDPECRTNIAPSGPGATAPGATQESCDTACKKLVTCSFIKTGDEQQCVGMCKQKAYQYQIDCVAGNECGAIKTACGKLIEGGGED